MKKTFILVSALLIVILLSACAAENAESKTKLLNIDPEQVESIAVSTQMTDPKQDVELNKEDREAVIGKLSSYTLEPTAGEAKKG